MSLRVLFVRFHVSVSRRVGLRTLRSSVPWPAIADRACSDSPLRPVGKIRIGSLRVHERISSRFFNYKTLPPVEKLRFPRVFHFDVPGVFSSDRMTEKGRGEHGEHRGKPFPPGFVHRNDRSGVFRSLPLCLRYRTAPVPLRKTVSRRAGIGMTLPRESIRTAIAAVGGASSGSRSARRPVRGLF